MFFVTGGTGYLGSALIDLLVREGHGVRAMVRNPGRADVLPAGVEQVPGDLGDEEAMVRGMAGCEGVFHLAASVGHSLEQTRDFNREGTKRVLRAATRAGVGRVVHTSSSAAIIQESGLVSEGAPVRTALVDPYSVTKCEAEEACFEAVEAGLDVRIVNVVNAYGPSPRGPFSYNALFRAALRGEVRAVVDARVGWVLAEDVAIGHWLAYEKGAPGKRYVLCGQTATFPEVFRALGEAAGTTIACEVLPPGSAVPPGSPIWAVRSEVYGRLGPMTVDDRQARAIGCAPRPLAEGLPRTVAWLRSLGAV